MSRYYKIILTTVFVCLAILVFFNQIIYICYLSGIYPAKAQVKDVSIEFNSAWLPAISSESPVWNLLGLKKNNNLHSTLFYKIEWLKPSIQGTISILWVGDKYSNASQSNNTYSRTMHFDWGTAYIIKKELTNDPNVVLAVVPEFNILINADNLDQLNEIKRFTKK